MSSKAKEEVLNYLELEKLRKKVLTNKLSASEQQQLESSLKVEADAGFPSYKEMRMASNIRWTALRNFTIADVTSKETLFQKINNRENYKEYMLRMLIEEDIVQYTLLLTTALDFRQMMHDAGLGIDWPKMLPVNNEVNYWDPLEDDDKEWFESIPNPNLCYEKLQEVVGLEEKADDHSNDMLKAIHWLKGN